MYVQILLLNESEPQEMALCGALHLHRRPSARLKRLTTDEEHVRGSAAVVRPGDTILLQNAQ